MQKSKNKRGIPHKALTNIKKSAIMILLIIINLLEDVKNEHLA